MSAAFTPGPWTLSTVPTSSGICHKIGPFPPRREDGVPRHACLYSNYNSLRNPADIELLANAHLIAAAPRMYHELVHHLEMTRVYPGEASEDFKRIDAILKAARGEA